MADESTNNPNTDFPAVSIGKTWKPVYEWISELSQLEYINSVDETSAMLVYGRPFIYWIDNECNFHWKECNDTQTSSYNITVGTTPQIYSINLNKKVFESVNFIIWRGGSDLKGNGTMNYEVDETVPVNNLKMRVIGMTDVARDLIESEIRGGNLVLNTSGSFTYGGNKYNAKAYSFSPKWNAAITVTNDTTYNNELNLEIKRICSNRSRTLIQGLGHVRWNGTINRKGFAAVVGSLFTFTSKKSGLNQELLRVMEINHSIDKTGWSTTLNVEQDQEVMENMGA
jgi:hypothetical protein